MVKNIAIGTGRRKTAVARVFVRDGSGKIVVNGKDVKEYFATAEQIQVVQQPLLVTSMGTIEGFFSVGLTLFLYHFSNWA